LWFPFNPSSPRIAAHRIHDWIYESLQLPESDIRMNEINVPRCHMYIKFHNSDRPYSLLQATAGYVEFRHDNSDLSMVNTD